MAKLSNFPILLLFCTLIIITSCSSGIGYGVILWSPEPETISNGTVYRLINESDLRDSYTIQLEDGTYEMDRWRIKYFSSEPDAEDFSIDYRPYADIMVRSKKEGTLPVRNKPETTAETVYKLSFNEEAKILENATGEVDLSGLIGTWYKILTKAGVVGYCFDYYLSVFSPGDTTKDNDEGEMDENLTFFFNNTWRPLKYAGMVDKEHIDLSKFKTSFGLFPNLEEKRIRLSTPAYTLNFDFEDIEKLSTNRYSFTGTSLQLTMRGDEEKEVVAQYTHDNDTHRYVYILLDRDINEIIQEELERREELYSSLRAKSSTLHSEAFGTITLSDTRTFTWGGNERLVPRVIPVEAQESGTIHMQVFIGLRLSEKYDGAVSFHFNGTPPETYIHFLFDITDTGVKLVYVPDNKINNNLVLEESLSPLTMFFSYR
jgi:hypothetical protein